jgi:hypothetical protein
VSTNLNGHLVSARSDNTLDEVLAGYYVTLFGASFKPKTVETKKDGEFNLSYGKDTSNVGFHRRLKVVVHDIAGREIRCISTHDAQSPPNFTFDKSGHMHFEDVDDKEINVGFLIIRDTEAKGFLVTLGTGKTPQTIAQGEAPPPGRPTVPSGWGLSRGNAVKLLI